MVIARIIRAIYVLIPCLVVFMYLDMSFSMNPSFLVLTQSFLLVMLNAHPLSNSFSLQPPSPLCHNLLFLLHPWLQLILLPHSLFQFFLPQNLFRTRQVFLPYQRLLITKTHLINHLLPYLYRPHLLSYQPLLKLLLLLFPKVQISPHLHLPFCLPQKRLLLLHLKFHSPLTLSSPISIL